MRAAKERGKNLIHVIKATKSDSRSVLKFSARNTSCAECRSKTFETLSDVKRHFESRHDCVVTFKSVSSDPKEAKAAQKVDRIKGNFISKSLQQKLQKVRDGSIFELVKLS